MFVDGSGVAGDVDAENMAEYHLCTPCSPFRCAPVDFVVPVASCPLAQSFSLLRYARARETLSTDEELIGCSPIEG